MVTGGAGFIGRQVVARLAARGDHVTALVRDPTRAGFLDQEGVELVASDLRDREALAEQIRSADGLIHGAGSYRIGIRPSERPAMWDANVGTTERVLGAAVEAGGGRIVYVSTINVFGNTHGEMLDETHRRDPAEGFLSWYDETKYRAHEVAEHLIAQGAPVIIVQPGQIYGPHDHSEASQQLALAHAGRLPFIAFPETGLAWVHVEDLSMGIVAALDRGRVGEAYSLAGDRWRLGDAVRLAARVGGRRAPLLTMPTWLLRSVAPIGARIPLPGVPPNMAETIRASAGVTYWASHAKATRELGFRPRALEQGIADTWGRRT